MCRVVLLPGHADQPVLHRPGTASGMRPTGSQRLGSPLLSTSQAQSTGPPSPNPGCGGWLDCKQSTLQGISSTHPLRPPKAASLAAWAPLLRSICRKKAPARHSSGGSCVELACQSRLLARSTAGRRQPGKSMGRHQPAGPICPQLLPPAASRPQHPSHGAALCAKATLQHHLVLVKQQGAVVACKVWSTAACTGSAEV